MRTVTAALPCAALALVLFPLVGRAADRDPTEELIARFDAGAELSTEEVPAESRSRIVARLVTVLATGAEAGEDHHDLRHVRACRLLGRLAGHAPLDPNAVLGVLGHANASCRAAAASLVTDSLRARPGWLGESSRRELARALGPIVFDQRRATSAAALEALQLVTGESLGRDLAAWSATFREKWGESLVVPRPSAIAISIDVSALDRWAVNGAAPTSQEGAVQALVALRDRARLALVEAYGLAVVSSSVAGSREERGALVAEVARRAGMDVAAAGGSSGDVLAPLDEWLEPVPVEEARLRGSRLVLAILEASRGEGSPEAPWQELVALCRRMAAHPDAAFHDEGARLLERGKKVREAALASVRVRTVREQLAVVGILVDRDPASGNAAIIHYAPRGQGRSSGQIVAPGDGVMNVDGTLVVGLQIVKITEGSVEFTLDGTKFVKELRTP